MACPELSAALPRWFSCYLVIFPQHGKQVSAYEIAVGDTNFAVVPKSLYVYQHAVYCVRRRRCDRELCTAHLYSQTP